MSTFFAPNPGATSVLIADSNRMQAGLLVSALRRRPGFLVSTCSVDLESLLKAIDSSSIQVILICLNQAIDAATQMAAMRCLHTSHPGVAKVLLTETLEREIVIAAFRSGARGIFCLANNQFRLLCRCIQRVADGQIWANTEQLNFLLEALSGVPSARLVNSAGLQILTPREEQVVALVAESLSNRDIARELNLSEHTVKKYVFHIFEKLGISSRVELALYAVNNLDSRADRWLPSVRTPIADA
jgi:DNA-binding NarL/FixJ family response regulator